MALASIDDINRINQIDIVGQRKSQNRNQYTQEQEDFNNLANSHWENREMIERDEALFEINHEGKVHDIDEIRSQEIGHDHDEEADDDGFQTEDMLNITDETTQGT